MKFANFIKYNDVILLQRSKQRVNCFLGIQSEIG